MTGNKNKNSGINVLSLCDGMSCGHIALDKAGIKVRASQTLLDLSLKNREQADIINRIQSLEEMLKSQEE